VRIAVIGTGYVGLTIGAGFAEFGNHVTCVDTDLSRIESLTCNRVPIHEPGLDELVARNAAAGRLMFTPHAREAVPRARVVFLAVPTPSHASGAVDLSAVEAAVAEVGKWLADDTLVVTKSTVPVGTTERVRAILREVTPVRFTVASNPEFLKEGAAVADFMSPDRVVIGVDDPVAERTLRALYAAVMRIDERVHVMDIASAELTKYAANAMLAVRVAAINELARLAERVGADIEPVRRALGADPRIGRQFLFPGPGFGGSCLPKDVRALVALAHEAGEPLLVVDAARRANDLHRAALGPTVGALLRGEPRGARVAVWGLAFKANTDDVRETPALPLIEWLCERGASVVGYDPAAMETLRARIGGAIELAADEYAAATGADVLVVLTEWKQFRSPDFERLAATMRRRIVFDARNLWDPEVVRAHGFIYRGVGRAR
jgi:UDPglucose 6-dehydrogenase